MFDIFNKRPLIGYKITNKRRDKKYGIAANNYKMFLDKAKQKFPYVCFLCLLNIIVIIFY